MILVLCIFTTAAVSFHPTFVATRGCQVQSKRSIVLVKKKDGMYRFCGDYRKLNSVTRKDAHPLPRIDDLLDSLHGSVMFSTLDLRSGYWQVNMHPDDREKTAFATPDALWELLRMPFSLSNACANFQ